MYISSQNELEAFIERASSSDVLAIDTEFLREKTYYPLLCLLQLATEEENVIVDPFSVDSLLPLKELLLDSTITKLFHAGSQDIEILYHEIGCIPQPLFDTQIAAALLGHSLQIGYGALVQSVCGITLKKGDSFTDWSVRPLAESQIKYAADDVIYLPELYRKMLSKLKALGRQNWLDADFAELADEARYINVAEERYKKLKRVNQLSKKQLSAAREVSTWREKCAMRRNIPRKWVMTDEQIVEACRREATSLDQLFMVRGMSEKLSTKDARAVVDAIKAGLALAPEEWPVLNRAHSNETNVDVEVDALAAIARLRAKENDIAYQALVTTGDLVSIARGHTDSEVLKGWRRNIVGNDLLDFMHGKSTLSIKDSALQVTEKQ